MRSRHNPLAGRQVRVLTRHPNFPRQILFVQSLHYSPGHPVVGYHHRVDLIVVFSQRVFSNLQSLDRQPVIRPLVRHNFDIAFIYQGLQNIHLSLAEHHRVMVCRRAADQHIAALGLMLH